MARLAGVLALLLALVAGASALAVPTFPTLTGRVVDDAHVLSPRTQAELTEKLEALEQATSRQLVVVTLPSLGGDEIDDYGYRLLRAWGIGQKATNNGALFIVVPSEHKVRIEVGYGLEGILTDALSSVILQRAVLPKFRAGDVEGGVVDGTNALVAQLSLDPSTAEAKAAQAAVEVQRPQRHGSPFGAILPIIFLVFIAMSLMRRGGGGLGWLLPMMILGGGRGGWGGGGFGGGGGGFGGGGGSGGGGGAREVGRMLTALDKDRIAEAIEAAEQGTSGEIVCALTGEVSSYREVPLAWGAAVALAAPPIALALGARPLAIAGRAGFWLAAQGSALENNLVLTLGLYALAQLVLFIAVALIVHIPAVRRRLTPKSLKSHRVDRAARHHFTALAASARGAETGVLIFVAVDDRQVRVLAAPSLHEKADEAAWTRAVDAIGAAMKAAQDPTSGIVEAIGTCGEALKAHFPAAGEAPRVFSNRPLEI